MSSRVLVAILTMVVVVSAGSPGQQTNPTTGSMIGAQEFPVVFQSSVTAGKTPVGTTIQAKLSMATLLNGIVVPQNAEFSGEIVVSQARTKNQASRLSLRMDTVSWENGSARVKVFLSEWFSPASRYLRTCSREKVVYQTDRKCLISGSRNIGKR